MKMQSAKVSKTLASVSKMVKLGNRVVFDGDWSYVENKKTGQKMGLREKEGVYVYDLWVKNRPVKEVNSIKVENRFGVFQGQVEDLI